MKDYVTLTLGLVVAYLVPGAIMAWGIYPYLPISLRHTPTDFQTGLFALVATTGCGTVVGGLRGVVLDTYRRERQDSNRGAALRCMWASIRRWAKGAQPDYATIGSTSKASANDQGQYSLPRYLDLSPLSDDKKLRAYEHLVEDYSRFYNFFGNLCVALPTVVALRGLARAGGLCKGLVSCREADTPSLTLFIGHWWLVCSVWFGLWLVCYFSARRLWIFYRTAATSILHGWPAEKAGDSAEGVASHAHDRALSSEVASQTVARVDPKLVG